MLTPIRRTMLRRMWAVYALDADTLVKPDTGHDHTPDLGPFAVVWTLADGPFGATVTRSRANGDAASAL